MSDSPEEQYVYRERQVPDMSNRYFAIGQGRISGYLSTVLGLMSLLAVLCWRYPEELTTRELRMVYDPEQLRVVLMICMWASLAFGCLTFVLNKRKRLGAVGVVSTLAAFMLGGYNLPAGAVDPHAVSIGLDWLLLDFLLTGAAFIFIEKIVPKYDNQAILRPAWQLDLFYFSINHLLIGVLLIIGNGFAPTVFGWAVNSHVQAFVSGLPLVAQLALLLVCADFAQYCCHRAFHEIPGLWKFHAVHHSSEHMDWLAGSRSHLVEILIDRSIVMVPLYLLGPSKAALDAYVLFAAVQAVFIHANVRVPFGPLKYVLTTPQFHHWHHSSDKPAIDTNYAVHLPIFDLLLGTFHMPDEHWPVEYGTTKPLPKTFVGQLTYPFRRDS
ncbi:MAG TPA: sterol desaturase family protein [Polyangiales bacterium]|nr:sterol desaturase family protein [Polyangiales bacterium]